MTLETCQRMMSLCLAKGDTEGAELYRKRIERKQLKLGIVPQEEPKEEKKSTKKKEVIEE